MSDLPQSDLPIALEGTPAAQLAAALDPEGKIIRALEALGPIAERDVALLGVPGGLRERQLTEAGARVTTVTTMDDVSGLAPGSADALVAWWSGFRGVDDGELRAADAVLRPEGRLLVVHDYGRDDVSGLRGDLPEYGAWSRRDGPFLRNGFRIRVLHCWWSFRSLDEAASFLGEAFGAAGTALVAELKRPRLSYNVAIYHRTRPSRPAERSSAGPVGAGA